MEDLVRQLRELRSEDRAAVMTALQDLGSSSQPGGATAPRVVHSLYQRKLRVFSGKTPVPPGEVDYDTWRRQVKQLEQEEETYGLSDSQKRRIILQSLLRPAADTVFNINGSSEDILEVLDTVYGSVVEGHELLLQFFTTYQTEEESCSEYVQRLYLLAVDVVEHKGITMAEKQHLNVVFIGHVDHGKSTTVGRILLEGGAIDQHLIDKYKKEADERGKSGFELVIPHINP